MRRWFFALGLVAAGCPQPAPAPAPPPTGAETPPDTAPPPVDSADAPPAGDGAAGCTTTADCPQGHVCEGEGCDAGAGTCAPNDRMCTRDYQPYCGCDGKTFHSSGGCPGARFAHRGPCEGDPASPAI